MNSLQPLLTWCRLSRPVGHQAGFTLLEALIATAVLGFGFATTMAFHGELLGSAGENRVRATAMSLAEAKMEELRARPFMSASLDAGAYEEALPDIGGFGFFSLRPVSLKRCWAIADETALKRVQVAVARASEECAPWSSTALATLTSRIARNDFGRAGSKAFTDSLSPPDGRGKIVTRNPEAPIFPGTANIPGGFQVVRHEGDDFAFCDPSVGNCVVPRRGADGVQRFALINGNIYLADRTCSGTTGTLAERCGLDIKIEGNALCRLHYPDDVIGAPPPALPAIAGVGSLSYLRYTCVVADQWRRSITILPTPDEKVCVGSPSLIPEGGDIDDQLRASSRFYDGRTSFVDPGGNLFSEFPHGVKGGPLTGDLSASIGTVCQEDDACWSDTASRGLVPGGHHFLIMPTDGGNCSSRMSALQLLDDAVGTHYRTLFTRNPDVFHCTSSKTYTGTYCTGYTRVSGFIDNATSLDLASQDLRIAATGGQLFLPCDFFGELGQSGGGYVCGIRHTATGATVRGTALNPQIEFVEPDTYVFSRLTEEPGEGDYAPSLFPLDVTARNFRLVDVGMPPTASFTVECDQLNCVFNASASDPGDGKVITIYDWFIGDGTPGAGVMLSHSFAAAGTYQVTLTVTNDQERSDSLTQAVTVTGAADGNIAPIAAFTFVCTDTRCAFDASASADSDGEITSYLWSFGDGATGSGAMVDHDYAAAGRYTVTLTVTDNEGAPGATVQVVPVATPVDSRICDITVSGRKQHSNATVSVSYDGGQFSNCSDLSGTDYRCDRSGALQGADIVIRSVRPGNHPILSHEFKVNCDAPVTTHNF